MGRRRSLVAGLAVALLVSGGVWSALRSDGTSPAAQGQTRPDLSGIEPGRVVHVETDVRSTTFLPLGAGPQDGGTLSAQRAYNLLVGGSPKLQLMPATVQPYYGVLSATGLVPRALDVRVWAFASESGCPNVAAGRCRLWEFVDARTGRDLGVVTHEVLPD